MILITLHKLLIKDETCVNVVGFYFNFRLAILKSHPLLFLLRNPIAFGVVSKNGDPFGLIILNDSLPSKKSNSVHAALINTSVEYISFQKKGSQCRLIGLLEQTLETITESYGFISQIGTLKCTSQAR